MQNPPLLQRRRALLALAAVPMLQACVAMTKRSAGTMPSDFKLEPLLVHSTFAPAEIKVTVSDKYPRQVKPEEVADTHRFAILFADRLRDDFRAKFQQDARAAGLLLRSAGSPGLTLTLQVTQFQASYVGQGGPFCGARVVGTMTDAAGKELWWFRTLLFEPSTGVSDGWKSTKNYADLVRDMLQAMRKDGLLPSLPPTAP